jgi:hypothetical protein
LWEKADTNRTEGLKFDRWRSDGHKVAEDRWPDDAAAQRLRASLRTAAMMAAVAVALIAVLAMAVTRVDDQAGRVGKELDRQRLRQYQGSDGVERH